MQINQIKVLPLLIFFFLIFLQYRLWFESDGVMDMLHLKKELARQNEENDKLKQRNDSLLSEIKHLQQDKTAVESRARTELGMIKKGETFYQVVK